MKSNRSILEQVNANRQRRTPPSLDDLNRTLRKLERQLQLQEQSVSQASVASGQHPSSDKASEYRKYSRARAADIRGAAQSAEPAGFSTVAAELQELREELRKEMSTGVRHELENLGKDMARLREMIAADGYSAHIADELGRVSAGVQVLAQKTRSEDLVVLREDLEELKRSVQTLAREETVSRLGNRWDHLDQRFEAIESRYAGTEEITAPSVQAIEAGLEQMRKVIEALPDSLSLHSLEDKVKVLAGAIEHLSRQRAQAVSPETIGQIGDRLDEISRAIAASARAGVGQPVDKAAIERIEARISLLSGRIEEMPAAFSAQTVIARVDELGKRMETLAARHENSDRRIVDLTDEVQGIARRLEAPASMDAAVERMTDLGKRIDEIARRHETSDETVLQLSEQVGAIARHLESAPSVSAKMLDNLDARITGIAARFEEVAKRLAVPDTALIDAFDSRFQALSQHLERHAEGRPSHEAAFIEGLEARLEDISRRLMESAAHPPAVDNDAIRSLEAQISGLAEHLSKSNSNAPVLDDIAPRLESIEQSISAGHDAVLAAARRAADEAVRSVRESGVEVGGSVIADLANDVKSLEALARRSDMRNAKTFDAIHETLLKIVERLAALETEMVAGQAAKAMLGETPSLQFDHDAEDSAEAPIAEAGQTANTAPAKRVSSAHVSVTNEGAAQDKQTSLLKGLSHIVKKNAKGKAGGQKEEAGKAATSHAQDPTFEAPAADAPVDKEFDPTLANRPLEPGSGVPDLNSIMRRVREERREKADGGRDETGKADFIAAARRAAQAAAAEADLLKQEPGSNGSHSRFSPAELVRRQRKPILMAVAAVIVAMAAFQVKNAFFSGRHTQIADHATMRNAPVRSAETQAQEKPAKEVQEARPTTPAASVTKTPPPAPAHKVTGEAKTPAPSATVSAKAPAPTDRSHPAAAAAASPAPDKTSPVHAQEATREVHDNAKRAAGGTADAQPAATPSAQSNPPVQQAKSAAATVSVPAEIGPAALREAAEHGDPSALFVIGNRYAEGKGVKSNMAEAAKWYQKAADLGFAPAEYRIGNLYDKGLGVRRNVAEAKSWYEKAAGQGNATAMHNLGVLMAMGVDGPADNKAAAEWFRKAAALGVKDSQYNLGIMAAKGLGMPKDLETSYKWFAIVAKTGDEDAANKRDQVAKVLSPDALKRARAAVEMWKPQPLVPAANSVNIPDDWRLSSPSETAAIDMKKAVINMQTILTKDGFDPGPVDGKMGQKTRDAIRAFQKAHGMKPTGKVDHDLVKALLEGNK